MPARDLFLCVLCACLLLASPATADSGAVEHGFPLIQAYNAASQRGETQNFGITRDTQGLLYLANLDGVLIFDGAWWREIPIGKAKNAFSVDSDATGRVAVGGVDDFGLLAPDDHGTL